MIVGRLVQLQVVQAAKLQAQAERERFEQITIPAERGEITSSDGTILAMTVETDQVTADPPVLAQSVPLAKAAAELAGPLGMTEAAVLNLLQHPTSPQYVVLNPSISSAAARRVSALGLPSITLQPSYQRYYPGGDLASGILGFTNNAGPGGLLNGVGGIEQQYNRLLTGQTGTEQVQIDAAGDPIPGTETDVQPAIAAGGVRLTINADIQWAAEQACAHQAIEYAARNCSIVVMAPGTGQILAMAQYPNFDPASVTSLAVTTDIPVATVFAPGSTGKVITAAAAMEHGGVTPASAFTTPWQITWHGFSFHDAEYHPTERYTLAGILAYSSNDGMVQVADHVTPAEQYGYLRAFGLGSPSGLNLPGESAGLLANPSQWYGNERYELSFGQGVSVTAIQMASVYATIANGGVRVAPELVAGTTTSTGRYVPAPKPASRRVIQPATAAALIRMLEQVPVVDAQGGEPWGLIPGYTVAAKTGTAQENDNTIGSSFIGIAPATNPQLVVAVNVQDPTKGTQFGISTAGPAFYDVMKFALQTLKIPPDGGHVPNVPLVAG